MSVGYACIHKHHKKCIDTVRSLLAQLHLDSLVGKRSPKAVRNALKILASGFYEDATKRINSLVEDREELADQVLPWIIYAKRPLRTLELQEALAVDVGDSELDEDNIPQVEDMVSVCTGLVTVDEESRTIRLVHYTAQIYFKRTQNIWFSNTDSDIEKTCVTYLSFEVSISGYFKVFRAQHSPCALYQYAAIYWGHHTRKASALLPEVVELLKSKPYVKASAQEIDFFNWEDLNSGVQGLQLTTYFGLQNAVKTLLNTKNLQNLEGRSPLIIAAAEGHGNVGKLLISAGFDIDRKDLTGWLPIHSVVCRFKWAYQCH